MSPDIQILPDPPLPFEYKLGPVVSSENKWSVGGKWYTGSPKQLMLTWYGPDKVTGSIPNLPPLSNEKDDWYTCLHKARSPKFPPAPNDKTIYMNPYRFVLQRRSKACPTVRFINHKKGKILSVDSGYYLQTTKYHVYPIIGYDKDGNPIFNMEWGTASFGTRRYVYGFRLRDTTTVEDIPIDKILSAGFLPHKFDKNQQDAIEGLAETSALADNVSSCLDVATTIAEGRETISGVLSTVESCISALNGRKWAATVKHWRKRRGRDLWSHAGKHVKRLPEQAANWWMFYRYGLMPNMYTIADAIKSQAYVPGEFLTTRAGEKDSSNEDITTTYSKFGAVFTVKRNIKSSCRVNVVIKSFIGGADPGSFKRFSFYIPTALYEVVPYSWVVDWFLNLGTYIQSTRSGVFSIGNSCTTKILDTNTTVVVPHQSFTFNSAHQYNSYTTIDTTGTVSCKSNGRLFNQTINFDRSVGSLDRKLVLEPKLNWKRGLDSCALMLNQLKRRH